MFITSTFARYIAVGLLNTAVGFSLYAIFIFSGLHYSLAVLLSTIMGVLFNFKTIGKIVFKNSGNHLLLRFIGVYTVTYFLNVMGLRIFDYFKIDMYLAGALILIPLAIISFILHKTFVFRTKGLT
jgi:putative flippase GtrA